MSRDAAMSANALAVRGQAAALRASFDRGFAEPIQSATTSLVDLLAIGIAGTGLALRLEAIAGIHVDRRVTPIPGPVAELVGLAGFRGAMVPIYDLAALLGQPPAAAPRWLVVLSGHTIGLAFERFESHRRVATAALSSQPADQPALRHVREVVRLDGELRAVLDPASILEALRRRAGETPRRER